MTNVFLGKIIKIIFENGQSRPYAIFETKEGKKYRMQIHSKGVWQFLRLEYGRKVDEEIKKFKEDYEDGSNPLHIFAINKIAEKKPTKELQIIVRNNMIITLASLKHNLYTEEKVYDMISKTIGDLKLIKRSYLKGRIIHIKDVPGFKLGIHIYAGDIYTQYAIKISTFIEVMQCSNIITFLSSHSPVISTTSTQLEKILRIHKQQDIDQRIPIVIENLTKNIDTALDYIETGKKMQINKHNALKLLSSINSSYYIGAKVTGKCFDRYLLDKKQYGSSVWALAMAVSWIAEHGDCFDNHHTKTRSALCEIAGSLLSIGDLDKSIANCDEYILKNEIASVLYAEMESRYP
jgi:hypothetical protein